MKFTKEDAYKELVGKMTANGEKLNLSERSFNEQLDTLIPLLANDETEVAEFIDKVLPLFKTADNNVRNDISVGINKYKEENPKKPLQVQTPPQQQQNEANGMSALEKRLAEMEAKLLASELKERDTNIRAEILSKLKGKGVNDDDWVNNLLQEVAITDDFNVDDKVETYLNLYNKSQAKVTANATPQGANSAGKPDVMSEAIKQAAAFAKSQKLIE